MDAPYVQVALSAGEDPRLADLPAGVRCALYELAIAILSGGPVDRTRANRLQRAAQLPKDCWTRLQGTGAVVEREGCLYPAPGLTNVDDLLQKREHIRKVRSAAGRNGGKARIQNLKQTPSFASGLPDKAEATGKLEVESKREESPSLRSGDVQVVSETPREPDSTLTQLRGRMVKERALEIARHWATLSGKNAPLKKAQAIAEFDIPMPQLLECLDRCWEAQSYDLASPVIRSTLQRLESDLRKIDGLRRGQPVDLAERLSVVSAPAGGRAS